ncbi:MAG: response regulator [Pseudomonadota bacterium]|nr:response regulator [Pseudomonadota bacterium]
MFAKEAKILIVDDMTSIRDLVRVSLNKLGYENITEAQDGMQALEMIKSQKKLGRQYDLVLCDWNMPRMMGIDLLKTVRRDPEWEFLPFILVTTESEKINILEAIASGVSDYIVKPFSVTVLQNKMASVHKRLIETLKKGRPVS